MLNRLRRRKFIPAEEKRETGIAKLEAGWLAGRGNLSLRCEPHLYQFGLKAGLQQKPIFSQNSTNFPFLGKMSIAEKSQEIGPGIMKRVPKEKGAARCYTFQTKNQKPNNKSVKSKM